RIELHAPRLQRLGGLHARDRAEDVDVLDVVTELALAVHHAAAQRAVAWVQGIATVRTDAAVAKHEAKPHVAARRVCDHPKLGGPCGDPCDGHTRIAHGIGED